jgi:hypothetical protein
VVSFATRSFTPSDIGTRTINISALRLRKTTKISAEMLGNATGIRSGFLQIVPYRNFIDFSGLLPLVVGCAISFSHSCDCEKFYRGGYSASYFVESQSMFRRKM